MKTDLIRLAIAGGLLAALAQAGPAPALAQLSGTGARYAAIARAADHVLLLDQIEGIIYQCPTDHESACFRRSYVPPSRR